MVRFLLLVSVIVFSVTAQSQNRYIVKFKDKNGTPYSLSNPSAYLSAKSVLRRTNQSIAIDSTDLPVLARYIDSVRLAGAVVILNKSKWLNQVAIQTNDAAALTKIAAFPFVSSASQIAFRTNQQNNPVPDKFASERLLNTNNANSNLRVTADYYNYGNSYTQIHIHNGELLHNYGFRGDNITIAVLDAGFYGYLSNRMFDSARNQNRILGTWDFVANEASVNEDHPHGMECLSTIAGNVPGVLIGTAPNAKFYLFRTEEAATEYPIEEQNWAAAAEQADSLGADMISSSLGYYDFDAPQFNHTYADMNGTTTIAARAGDFAVKKGMIVTNSAGNNGQDAYKYVITPADGKLVMAIGATNPTGTIANFSAWGPSYDGRVKPDIASVGLGVYVAGTDGNAYTSAGTSFSNPNVNGLIASLWSGFPEMKAADVIDAVKKSSHKFSAPDDRYGYGIPNFKKAFADLLSRSITVNTVADGDCKAVLNWDAKDDTSFSYKIERQLPTQGNFSVLATVKGKTISFQKNNYVYRDTLTATATGNVLYRVTMNVRTDTSLTVLNKTFPLTSPCIPSKAFTVSPNPFSSSVTLQIFDNSSISKLSVRLVNTNGQIVYRYEGSKLPGIFTLNISGGTLAKGMYILQVADNSKIIYKQKVIRK